MKKQIIAYSVILILLAMQGIAQNTNRVAKYTTGTSLTPGIIFDNGINVAIGTGITPITKLHVLGNAVFSNSAAPTSAAYIKQNTTFSNINTPDYTWYNNYTTGLFHPATNAIGFASNGVEVMRIHSNGFIGINNSNPTQMLHINQGAILVQGTNPNGGPMISFGGSASSAVKGEYSIEYNDHSYPSNISNQGLNFWKPVGSHKGTGDGFANFILFLNNEGNIGMGVDPTKMDPAYKLSVNGAIRCTKISVETGWADYVFDKEYKLMPLNELANFVSVNKHLPNIPAAGEVKKNGLDLGSIQTKQMEKIEELTLYLLQLNQRLAELEKTQVKK